MAPNVPGRPETALDHPLGQLERAQFIYCQGTTIFFAPIVRCSGWLTRCSASTSRCSARAWTSRYASVRTLGGRPGSVGSVQVSDPQAKQSFELDVVAEAEGEKVDGKPVLLAVGEAKSSAAPRKLADVARLERLRGLLAARAEVGRARLLLFSRSGFDADVIALAGRRGDLELVDIERLYEGD